MGVPGRMNSIYKGEGFGEDGRIGSKGHPKKEISICEDPGERKSVEL